MKRVLVSLAALAAAATASGALAADLPMRSAPPAPVPYVAVPVFTWTGFYAGVNGGYAWGDKSDRNYVWTYHGAFDVMDSVSSRKLEGGFGGGQIGYNFQSGALVYGLEADFQGSSIQNSRNSFPSVAQAQFGYTGLYTGRSQLDYFGTVRARLGYSFDRWLVYATGGLAYGDVKSGFNYTDTNVYGYGGSATVSRNTTKAGYAVGAGVEYAITPNWSAKVEYQYIDLGKGKQIDAAYIDSYGPTGYTVSTRDRNLSYQTVRGGINYKFSSW